MKYSALFDQFMLTGLLLFSILLNAASANVLVSIRPIAFIAAAITQGVTTSEVLLPNGVSPHGYMLRPSDIQRIKNANLVIWVGPEMEIFLTKTIRQLADKKNIELMAVESIMPLLIQNKKRSPLTADHDHGRFDSHLWLSPIIAKKIAQAIHDKLIEQLPESKDKIDKNFSEFIQEVEITEQNVAKMLKPIQGKGYFVFHDAYQYFERHFNLSQLGYFTVDPEIQAGAKRLHQIKATLMKQKAECVFAEPQFSPAVINVITQGTPVRKGTLDPLGDGIQLSKDSYTRLLTRLSQQFVSCLDD